MLKLAEKFADFVNKKKEPLVIDAEDVTIKTQDTSEADRQAHNLEDEGSSPSPATKDDIYALHDQRETGLREGIPPVSQQGGAEAQQVGTDSATETGQ